MDYTDSKLMELTAQGDDEAYALLVQRHYQAIFGAAVKMLKDRYLAEELTQKVFLQAYRAASRYEPRAKLRTWLYTILRRLVLNQFRKKEIQSSSLVTENGEDRDITTYQSALSPLDHLMKQEQMEWIERIIDELPPRQRMAVILKSYEDLSYEEIAKILGVSVPATKSLLFRARETLRMAFQKWEQNLVKKD
ncbi:RNA polymerase sigma factor [Methylacidiphilum caldifontis]|uniref:RNA polymerase sigma factor n=1 Tax=Methylacidiphilum caldifontis TaxID=2795386 RepID=A0A4Y8PG04_9BACT|nr:RNA polymerase sigma factor [Methylacidiphilum caldifontis]QSR88738.1 RNA polymerase sigma factor [Methylacidiphilum caldifontis]TFE70823.1 RNA polymerase subunit sigma [Methylacidiphilum caldifontis]